MKTVKNQTARVHWRMGQALLPEHFYAQESSLREEALVRARLSPLPFFGVGALKWDAFQLVRGIVSLEELDDGRFNIVLLGSHRFRLIKEAQVDALYRCADVDITAFDDEEPPALSLGQRAEVEREARRLGDAMGLAVDWTAVSRLDDEMLVNAIAQVAPFDVGAKQALLEQPTLAGRADLLVQLVLQPAVKGNQGRRGNGLAAPDPRPIAGEQRAQAVAVRPRADRLPATTRNVGR